MNKFGDVLSKQRQLKNISIKNAAKKLLIKEDQLIALEEQNWQMLPESTFVKGYIKSYSEFLGLNPDNMIALYRR